MQLTHHVGLGVVDDQPGGDGIASGQVAVAVRRLGAEDVPITSLLELATPEPLGQDRSLVFRDRALDLQQQLIIGIIGNRVVQEGHLATGAPELLQQQDLIGVFAGEAIRAEHGHHIDGRVADGVAQAVQAWPVQAGAAIALVAEHMACGQDMPLVQGPASRAVSWLSMVC